MKRRQFINNIGKGVLISSIGTLPLVLFASVQDTIKLTILHTNDVHSRLEPFPMDGS